MICDFYKQSKRDIRLVFVKKIAKKTSDILASVFQQIIKLQKTQMHRFQLSIRLTGEISPHVHRSSLLEPLISTPLVPVPKC